MVQLEISCYIEEGMHIYHVFLLIMRVHGFAYSVIITFPLLLNCIFGISYNIKVHVTYLDRSDVNDKLCSGF